MADQARATLKGRPYTWGGRLMADLARAAQKGRQGRPYLVWVVSAALHAPTGSGEPARPSNTI
jgi:hypothetical protein